MSNPYRDPPPETEYRFTSVMLEKRDAYIGEGQIARPQGDGWQFVATHAITGWHERDGSATLSRLIAVWSRQKPGK